MTHDKCEGVPIFIFMNSRTGGTGEIIAAILIEYRAAMVIGEKTMSPVSVNAYYQISNNYYIEMYHGNFMVADKYSLTDNPIIPNISFDSPVFEKLNLGSFR